MYCRQGDARTWANLKAAIGSGAACEGIWVARWLFTNGQPIPPVPWDDVKTKVDCNAPLLAWQYQNGPAFDCDILNPNLDGDAILSRLILPPAPT